MSALTNAPCNEFAPTEEVYLAGDPGRRAVDRLAFADLARFFEWIRYPSSDDLEILDDSFEWLLFVTHEGWLASVRLGI